MLKSLEIKNFTVFEEAKLEFCEGLNVIIGENGTGKTHLLKLGYVSFVGGGRVIENTLQKIVFDVFRTEEIDNLISFRKKSASFKANIDFKTIQVDIDQGTNIALSGLGKMPNSLFIPTREILSIYEGFAAALRNRELAFDSTFLDLADALALTHLKGEKLEQVKPFIATLEKHMGGKVILERGRFYLEQGKRRLEMPLVAEGIRKFAMLAHLLANGSIQKGTSVFWDEPESNLNPKLIRHLAEILVQLANFGVQIFIATHSLFLLRELEIQMALHPETPSRYFALKLEKTGVKVSQGDTLTEIDPITVLDVELEQSDRYLEVV
jgi:AAA15 family ATPase/GTPase